MLADGFRDGRHELSPLCPGACGARPRLVGDSIRLRRGHLRGHRQKARPARACRFRDGPARDPGKSPRAGCLGHHHQSFKSGHTMSAVHPAPLSYLQGASPWRISCWVRTTECRFLRTCSGVWWRFWRRLNRAPARGPGEARQGKRRISARAWQTSRRRWRPVRRRRVSRG